MSYLPYIFIGVYLLAINVYALFLIRNNSKCSRAELQEKKFINTKILLASLFGGAITSYISLIIFKYKTENLLLMTIIPLMIIMNFYIIFWLIRGSIMLL